MAIYRIEHSAGNGVRRIEFSAANDDLAVAHGMREALRSPKAGWEPYLAEAHRTEVRLHEDVPWAGNTAPGSAAGAAKTMAVVKTGTEAGAEERFVARIWALWQPALRPAEGTEPQEKAAGGPVPKRREHTGETAYDPNLWLVTEGGEATPYECMGHGLTHDCEYGTRDPQERPDWCDGDCADCDGCGNQEELDYRGRQFTKRPDRPAALEAVRRTPGPESGGVVRIWPPYRCCADDQRYGGEDAFEASPERVQGKRTGRTVLRGLAEVGGGPFTGGAGGNERSMVIEEPPDKGAPTKT